MRNVAFDPQGRPTQPITLAAIPDREDHGTAVIAAAAGRGTTNLGTGVHPLIRPVYDGATTNGVINALESLALDPMKNS